MNAPRFSIVIPSYNHEDYIEAAVESCFAQSAPSIEIVVVDDGSKDRSLPYLRKIKDARFRLVEQENRGAHAAINRGLRLARGDVLTILNSDDTFEPDRLDLMFTTMRESKCDFACSWIRQFDAEGRHGSVKEGWSNQLPSWMKNAQPVPEDSKDEFLDHLARSNFISTTTNMVFTRRLYHCVGGMRELRFVHDWDFALRAACRFRSVLVPRPLMNYRTHGANTIKSNRQWMMFEVLWVFATHLPSVEHRLTELGQKDVNYGEIPPIDLGANKVVYDELRRHFADARSNGSLAPEEAFLRDEPMRRPYIEMIV